MQEVLLNSGVFTEIKVVLFSKVFRLKAFCSFDAPFGSILKKYTSFSRLHYSLVATSVLFAELKQFKAICPGNRHTHRHTEQTTVTLAMRPRTVRLIIIPNFIQFFSLNNPL